ncbi:hypothetical protein PIB30_102756 [Stylosanthes scabra]|uniref:Uncharacterized protein n=1 Tax=Stylosanthes scabra TaxID=79078 RepID=A0ABU6SYI1_9FABA|nr:hypothetical protein [Stylosanthes scabra]
MDSRQAWESLPSSRTSHVWSMSLDKAKCDSPKLTSPSTTQGHVLARPKRDPNMMKDMLPKSKQSHVFGLAKTKNEERKLAEQGTEF